MALRFDRLDTAQGPLLDLILRQGAYGPQAALSRSLQERLRARSAAGAASSGGYGETAMARELDDLRAARVGQRNHALNKAAFPLFQLVDAGVLDLSAVQHELTSAGHDLGLGDFEIMQTLRSAAEGAARMPRSKDRLPEERHVSVAPQVIQPLDIVSAAPAPGFDPETGELAEDGSAWFRAKLVDTDEIINQPKPVPLIEGHLFKGTLAALYGHPGTMKSFAAIDWAMCIATGSWWKRHPVQRGPVLYVVAEGKAGAGERVKAWQEHNKVHVSPDIMWLPEPAHLMDPTWCAGMAAYIQAEHPALVVVDTLSRSMPGGDENSSVDMTTVIGHLDAMRAGTPTTVLLVHHTPKMGGGLRGHSSLHGATDTEAEMRRDLNSVTMVCSKQKDAEEFADVQLWWVKVGDSIALTTDPQECDVDKVDRDAEELWQTLRQDYRHTGASKVMLTEQLGWSDMRVLRAINRLKDWGDVIDEGRSAWRASVGAARSARSVPGAQKYEPMDFDNDDGTDPF